MKHPFILILSAAIFFTAGCDRGPKVIPAPNENPTAENNTGIFSEQPTDPNVQQNPAGIKDVHTVVVEEVLPTEKYVYLRVKEGNEEFWIATGKQEVKVGEAYFYREGLLKTNFESKEYNRTFDKIYLVSKIVQANHGNASDDAQVISESSTPVKIDKKGSVKIADLKATPEKYAGKTIQVSGKCKKVNPNIMGRNWIHLNDGSTDYDLVITSASAVSVGQTVTMTGTVVLSKDLGAGYFFDILLEDAEVIN